jgi:hypothetical protein
MAIKPEAMDIHFAARPDESELARLLDEAFDVTSGTTLGQQSIWIADPKQHVRERFGLQHEVLVVYSPHQTTDARTLTAIEQISRDPSFRHRIDKVIVLLIHRGDREQTEDLAKTDLDRLIIPIQVDELRDPGRGTIFLRRRIASRTGEIDLFGKSSPISADRYFFGRNDLVQSLAARITSQGENGGLFGLRKTGKTSVLKAIQRRVSDRPVVAAYMDCSSPGVHSARWWEALEGIAERLAETVSKRFGVAPKLRLDYSLSNAGLRFAADISMLINEAPAERLTIMLDEVEYITPGIAGALGQHWDGDFVPFWQTIRATHQELDGRFTFIVAGVNPACVQEPRIGHVPNPIFQLGQPHYLEPFTIPAVREMVRTLGRYSGLRFEEDVYGYLQSTYGGHPFLIRIACSEVSRDTDRSRVDAATLVNCNSFTNRSLAIRSRLAEPIRDILLSLVWWYPEEYDLLQILAAGGESFFKDYLAQHGNSVVRFAQYGILAPDLSGRFAIADLQQFLLEDGEVYKKQISPFTRGDMPPELLPEVPDLEALAQLFTKKTELEILLRGTIIMYLGVLCNWDNTKIAEHMSKGLGGKRERKNPDQLFLGRTPQEVINDLFTIDLKSIIMANWGTFAPLFDSNQTRFEMNMDTVNRARRVDAHTKPVAPREVQEFNNSYEWMLSRLRRVPNLPSL